MERAAPDLRTHEETNRPLQSRSGLVRLLLLPESFKEGAIDSSYVIHHQSSQFASFRVGKKYPLEKKFFG